MSCCLSKLLGQVTENFYLLLAALSPNIGPAPEEQEGIIIGQCHEIANLRFC
jgi:hypothetical protein